MCARLYGAGTNAAYRSRPLILSTAGEILFIEHGINGEDRPAAVRRLAGALYEFRVGGIQTNIPFLQRLIEHPDFVNGNVSTSFVPKFLEESRVEVAT